MEAVNLAGLRDKAENDGGMRDCQSLYILDPQNTALPETVISMSDVTNNQFLISSIVFMARTL